MARQPSTSTSKLIAYTDGGARGNPGPSALGVAIYDEAGKLVFEVGEYLGHQTNNYAEYSALIRALQEGKRLGATHLACFLDSELVVRQLAGMYRVKNAALQELFQQARALACGFTRVTFEHVRREKNKAADALVNQALDRAAAQSS